MMLGLETARVGCFVDTIRVASMQRQEGSNCKGLATIRISSKNAIIGIEVRVKTYHVVTQVAGAVMARKSARMRNEEKKRTRTRNVNNGKGADLGSQDFPDRTLPPSATRQEIRLNPIKCCDRCFFIIFPTFPDFYFKYNGRKLQYESSSCFPSKKISHQMYGLPVI